MIYTFRIELYIPFFVTRKLVKTFHYPNFVNHKKNHQWNEKSKFGRPKREDLSLTFDPSKCPPKSFILLYSYFFIFENEIYCLYTESSVTLLKFKFLEMIDEIEAEAHSFLHGNDEIASGQVSQLLRDLYRDAQIELFLDGMDDEQIYQQIGLGLTTSILSRKEDFELLEPEDFDQSEGTFL